jgi:hypothetical protein
VSHRPLITSVILGNPPVIESAEAGCIAADAADASDRQALKLPKARSHPIASARSAT